MILFLTSLENAFFKKIPHQLTDGYLVHDQGVLHEETETELELRIQMVRVNEELWCALESLLRSDVKNDDEPSRISRLTPEVLAELAFMLGTQVLSRMIVELLTSADSRADIEGVAGLTQLRYALGEANEHRSSQYGR